MGRWLVHGGCAIKYLGVNSVADYKTIKIHPQILRTNHLGYLTGRNRLGAFVRLPEILQSMKKKFNHFGRN